MASAGALRRARSGSPGHFGSARSLINDRREFDMARCRRVVSSRRAAPCIKRRCRENRRCACGGEASDTPRHQGWIGPSQSEKGFINLSIGVVRRHVRFGVVHEGYNHEPGAKRCGGDAARLRESPARTGSSAACGDRRGKGGAIASRVVNRTSGALKQYEYPICEITKTGLLPPGVINTGEFVHHRAWVGRASRTPRRAFAFIGCYRSLANWSRACVRTSRASRRAQRLRMPLHSNSPALGCSAMPALGESN